MTKKRLREAIIEATGKSDRTIQRWIKRHARDIPTTRRLAELLIAKRNDVDITPYATAGELKDVRELDQQRAGAATTERRVIIREVKRPRAGRARSTRVEKGTAVPPMVMSTGQLNEFLRSGFDQDRRKIGRRLKKICGSEEKLRKILLRDISDAARCFAHGVWKPAVILCGGAIEGILSQLIAREPGTSRDAAYLRAYPKQKRVAKMKDYKLFHYLDVAAELGIIRPTTAKLGHGVRDYRNYIHPLAELEEEHEITDGDARIACQLVFNILEEVGK